MVSVRRSEPYGDMGTNRHFQAQVIVTVSPASHINFALLLITWFLGCERRNSERVTDIFPFSVAV